MAHKCSHLQPNSLPVTLQSLTHRERAKCSNVCTRNLGPGGLAAAEHGVGMKQAAGHKALPPPPAAPSDAAAGLQVPCAEAQSSLSKTEVMEKEDGVNYWRVERFQKAAVTE